VARRAIVSGQPRGASGAAATTPAPAAVAQGAFATGFFIPNALNPKVALFSFHFCAHRQPGHTELVQAGYGLWWSFYDGWFSLVSVLFTRDPCAKRFLRHGPLDRVWHYECVSRVAARLALT